MNTDIKKTQQSSSPSQHSATSQAASVASEKLQQAGQHFVAGPARDLFGLLKDYAHDKPDVTALWCLGLGLIIGWKLRG